MQSYTAISASTELTDSLTPLLNNDQTAISQSSGTAFPTTNLLIGMACYRTDTSKLYVLTSTGPSVWTLISDLSKLPVETDGSGNATITGLFTTGTLAAGAATISGLLTAASASITGALACLDVVTLSKGLNEAKGTDLASATTVNIGASPGNYINITGTTAITAFDSVQAGTRRMVNFSGALLLTYNATNMQLPGAANIQTAAGDKAVFISLGGGNWTCAEYTRANGQCLTPFGKEVSIASASATDLGSTGSNQVNITGTTAITGFGSSAILSNPLYMVRFAAALTLTYDATQMKLPGLANIQTAAGDFALMLYLGSGNWQCLNYTKATGQQISATGRETNLASGTVCDLGTAGSNVVKITGTTTIASFGSGASVVNPIYFVRFAAGLTLTYNATTMILPGGVDIAVAAGDSGVMEYLGSGNWQCVAYQRANGQSVIGGGTDTQTFNSPGSGTWTKPAGTTSKSRTFVQIWAGGGSGATGQSGQTAGGGGGGGYSERWYNTSSLGSTETAVVGAGGSTQAVDNSNGNDGANSTFSSSANLLTSYKGGGGGASAAGGYGGGGGGGLTSAGANGSTGTPSVPAQGGGPSPVGGGNGGITVNAPGSASVFGGGGGALANSAGSGGNGGSSVYGGGGGGGDSNGTAQSTGGVSVNGGNGGGTSGDVGQAGTQPGGGGGGGFGIGKAGGAGAAGRIIVTTFI